MPAQLIEFPSTKVQLPSENERILADVDRLIRLTLNSMNLDEELINHVAERIRDFVEKYASVTFNCRFDLAVPHCTTQEEKAVMQTCLDKGIEGLAAQVQGMVNKIIMERVMLEIEMFQERRAAGPAIRLVPNREK